MSRTKPCTAPTGWPLGPGHLRQGVKDLVNERMGIDQIDRLATQEQGGIGRTGRISNFGLGYCRLLTPVPRPPLLTPRLLGFIESNQRLLTARAGHGVMVSPDRRSGHWPKSCLGKQMRISLTLARPVSTLKAVALLPLLASARAAGTVSPSAISLAPVSEKVGQAADWPQLRGQASPRVFEENSQWQVAKVKGSRLPSSSLRC